MDILKDIQMDEQTLDKHYIPLGIYALGIINLQYIGQNFLHCKSMVAIRCYGNQL